MHIMAHFRFMVLEIRKKSSVLNDQLFDLADLMKLQYFAYSYQTGIY